jgi:hypothetical protein
MKLRTAIPKRKSEVSTEDLILGGTSTLNRLLKLWPGMPLSYRCPCAKIDAVFVLSSILSRLASPQKYGRRAGELPLFGVPLFNLLYTTGGPQNQWKWADPVNARHNLYQHTLTHILIGPQI